MIPSPTKPMRSTGGDPTRAASGRSRGGRVAVEPEAMGHRGRLGAAAHVELGQDPRHVHAGRLLGHEERVADLAVRAPLGYEDEDLALARREAEGVLLRDRLRDGLDGRAIAAGEDEPGAGGEALDLVAQPACAQAGGDLVRA